MADMKTYQLEISIWSRLATKAIGSIYCESMSDHFKRECLSDINIMYVLNGLKAGEMILPAF